MSLKQLLLATPVCLAMAATSAWAAGDKPVTVQLSAQNNSGETGTATLTPQGNKTQVELQITGGPKDVAQPAHIHAGSCTQLNPAPKYPLQNVSDGKSTTTLDVPLSQIMSGGGAINVHKSAQDLKTYVACGDLKASP